MFGNHGLCGLLEEGGHGKSPKCLDGNLGDFFFGGGILQRSQFLSIIQENTMRLIIAANKVQGIRAATAHGFGGCARCGGKL